MEEREFTLVCKDCTVLLKQKIVDISPNEAGNYIVVDKKVNEQ